MEAYLIDDGVSLVALIYHDIYPPTVNFRPSLPYPFQPGEEEFGEAAVRKVEEETGVKSTFEGLQSMRHQYNLSFGVDDTYVVTRSAAVTDESRLYSSEIKDARWVPFAQF